MKTKSLYVALILVFSYGINKAQKTTQIKIGDAMPSVSLNKMIPKGNPTSNTDDYKDKLLIIDLWATNCGTCIEAMPKLDSLQRRFGNQIRILPVTSETEAKISSFWEKSRYVKGLSLFTLVEDTIISNYFPHRFISHAVWVYKGKVVAITGSDQVNAVNIQKVLSGEEINLPVKDDFMPGFDGAKQSLRDTSAAIAGSSKLIKYATINPYNDKIRFGSIVNDNRGGITRDPDKRSVRSYFINQPVYDAYLWALLNARGATWFEVMAALIGAEGGFERNRVVWEVTDKSIYRIPDGANWNEWISKHAICYEALNPDTGQMDKEVYQHIVRDLNDLLGLDVRFEKQKIKTLILTRSSEADLLKTKNPGIDPSYHKVKENNIFMLRDNFLMAFIKEFNRHGENPYAIDGTGYRGKIDMDLNMPSWTDLPAVKKELGKYGLIFKEEVREVELLVFTETGGGYKQTAK